MKKAFLLGISLVAMGTAPALAADLAPRMYSKAPAYVPPPIYSWAGFYIGLNGGGGSSHNCWTMNGVLGVAVPSTGEGCHDATGALAGGQIGYRWQASNWVFGLEAQGDWANFKGSNSSTIGLLAAVPYTNQTKIDALGLFTGQIGYAWNNVLWYAKGGAALTHDKYNGLAVSPLFGVPGGTAFDRSSETRWGGTVGTGVEIGFAPGWSVAVEYDHLFMGRATNTFTAAVGPAFTTRSDSIKQDADIGTVRINYTFGGPVMARY